MTATPQSLPFVRSSDTSREAAAEGATHQQALREQVAVWFRTVGTGACFEVEAAFADASHQSISARIRDLVLDGQLIDSGARKVNPRTGRRQTVYRLTRPGDPPPEQKRCPCCHQVVQ